MEFYELIRKRYSVRAYQSTPVEDEKLRRILEAATLAPTAANRQSFQLVIVKTAGKEDALKAVYPNPWFAQAPLVICACGLPQQNWVRRDGKNYVDVDVAIMMDHLILAATNEGLGTCWIGAFNAEPLRMLLNLPLDVEPIALAPLGYPADQPGLKRRKAVNEFVRYEQW